MKFLTNHNYDAILKYSFIFIGASAASEIIYRIYLRLKKHNRDNIEINELILSNNMSGCCRTKPRVQGSPARLTKEMLNESPVIVCKNRYCVGKNLERIIDFIDSAEKTIDLAMYIFTCQELAEAMYRAQHRGVKVRVIGEKSMAYSSGSQMLKFMSKGT